MPITQREFKAIRNRVRSLPPKRKTELQTQVRYHGTCIFYDLDHNRCGIYDARPDVCRRFGLHKNLACPFAPEAAVKEAWNAHEEHIGMLSIDFTWKDFA